MVLVDTSVWVSHLRDSHQGLVELLEAGEVVCRPFVIGELACGNLGNREIILGLLEALPAAHDVRHQEVLPFIEARHLMGRGLGYVDVRLLAAALVSGGLRVDSGREAGQSGGGAWLQTSLCLTEGERSCSQEPQPRGNMMSGRESTEEMWRRPTLRRL